MKQCFDEGTIQAFLDGELAASAQETVARHVAVCDSCAHRLAEAETEIEFAFDALEREFDALVPTNRLWRKINDSIEGENKKSVWSGAFENLKKLFAKPAAVAFAGLLICAAMFVVVQNRQPSQEKISIARENKSSGQIVAPMRSDESNKAAAQIDSPRAAAAAQTPAPVKAISEYRFVRANFTKRENNRAIYRNTFTKKDAPKNRAREEVSDETGFLKTITILEKTVDRRKDEVLKPSARFSFEKDLAVANDAIAKMKLEVERNPKDEAARRILLASYQNKIALLNSVAEKTELMASLK